MTEDPKLELQKPTPRPALLKGDAWRTLVKLAVASVIVGGVLAFVGVSPVAFWRGVFDSFRSLLSFIGDSAGEIAVNLLTYLFFGALIVVPVWLTIKLLSDRRP
jgi:hypothetical protein